MHFCVFDKMLQKCLSFLNLNQLSPEKMTDIFGATQQTFWLFLFCQSNVLLSRNSLIFNSLPTVYTAWTESGLSKLFLILTRAKGKLDLDHHDFSSWNWNWTTMWKMEANLSQTPFNGVTDIDTSPPKNCMSTYCGSY